MDEDGSLDINFNVTSTGSIVNFNRIITSVSNGNTGNISTLLNGNLDDGYTLTLNPLEDWNGVFDVRLEVVNDNSNSDTEIFSVTVNAQDDAPSLDMLTITVDEDDDSPSPRFLYLYDVDTDSNLNIVPDTYNSPPFEVSLDTNDNISWSFISAGESPHPTTGELSLAFSYFFENIIDDWNGTEIETGKLQSINYAIKTTLHGNNNPIACSSSNASNARGGLQAPRIVYF